MHAAALLLICCHLTAVAASNYTNPPHSNNDAPLEDGDQAQQDPGVAEVVDQEDVVELDHQPRLELSADQVEFFRMLDETIDQGNEYDPTDETDIALEEEHKRKNEELWNMCVVLQRAPAPPTPPPLPQSPPPPQPQCQLSRSTSQIAGKQQAPIAPQCIENIKEHQPLRRTCAGQEHRPLPSTSAAEITKPTRNQRPIAIRHNKVGPLPNYEENDTGAGTSKASQGTVHKKLQRQNAVRYKIPSRPLKEQFGTSDLARQLAASTPVASSQQGTEVDSSNTNPGQQRQRKSLHLRAYLAMKRVCQRFNWTKKRRSNTVFSNINQTDSYEMDEQLAERNEHQRLRETRSAPGRLNAQQIARPAEPLWPQLPPALFGCHENLMADDLLRSVKNWQKQFGMLFRTCSIEGPSNLRSGLNRDELKRMLMAQIVNLVGNLVVSSDAATNFPSAPYITAPSTSALSTSTLSITDPSTSTLSTSALSTSTLSTSATSSTTANEAAQPKSKKGKCGKHPAKKTKNRDT